jgi:hypothetical protein
MRKPLWNDRAFKRWVREGAKAKGMPVHEVLKAAGVNKYYLNENADDRGTNIVMNLAEVIGVSPAPLSGLSVDQQDLKSNLRFWQSLFINKDLPRPERLALTARLFATQAAALTFIAADQERCDPTALMELVLREFNRVFNNDPAPIDTVSTDESAS